MKDWSCSELADLVDKIYNKRKNYGTKLMLNQIVVTKVVNENFSDERINQLAACILRGFDLTKRFLIHPELASEMTRDLIPQLRRLCVNKMLHDFAMAREGMSARYATNPSKNSHFAELLIGPFIVTCHHVINLKSPPRNAKYRQNLAQLNLFSEHEPEFAPAFEEGQVYANIVYSGRHDQLTGIGLGVPDHQTKGWHFFKSFPILPELHQAEIENTDKEILLGIKDELFGLGLKGNKRKAEG